MTSKADEEAEEQEFQEQLEIAIERVAEPISHMLQAGEIEPYVIVFAMAKVAGELTAAYAAASGKDLRGAR